MRSPVRMHSPMFYVHAELERGGRATRPAEHLERGSNVAAGAVELDHRVDGVGRMLVLAPGEPVAITDVEKAIVLLLGGEPLGERFVECHFVSSSRERIAQAKAAWRAGRAESNAVQAPKFHRLPTRGRPCRPVGASGRVAL